MGCWVADVEPSALRSTVSRGKHNGTSAVYGRRREYAGGKPLVRSHKHNRVQFNGNRALRHGNVQSTLDLLNATLYDASGALWNLWRSRLNALDSIRHRNETLGNGRERV